VSCGKKPHPGGRPAKRDRVAEREAAEAALTRYHKKRPGLMDRAFTRAELDELLDAFDGSSDNVEVVLSLRRVRLSRRKPVEPLE
jgi:hypothetical protein